MGRRATGRTVWRLLAGGAFAVVISIGLAIPVLAAAGAFSTPIELDSPHSAALSGGPAVPAGTEGGIAALVTVVDSVDNDGDGVRTTSDNCPSVPNGSGEAGVPGVGNQTNTDAVADPWPTDIFPLGAPDRLVGGQDLVAFLPGLFKGIGQDGYVARPDIFEPGSVIDGQDLVAVLPYLFKGCQPP